MSCMQAAARSVNESWLLAYQFVSLVKIESVENLKHQPGPEFKFSKRSGHCSQIVSTFLVLKVAISSLW